MEPSLTMFKPADIILAIILIIAGFTMSFYLAAGKTEGNQVTVTVDGTLFGVYSLAENQTVEVKDGTHENRFRIQDGTVTMIQANCHGQDCIQQGTITRTGDTIVCLPNKVVLEITGGEKEFDTIAK